MRRLLPVVAALALAGCGSADGPATRSPSTDAIGSAADHHLQVTVDRGDGAAPQTATLVCDGGDDAGPACDHLAAVDDPFAPLPDDVMCTEQFGGPETASVVGRWNGEPVDLSLSRTDGCRIAQWDALGPLLPPI